MALYLAPVSTLARRAPAFWQEWFESEVNFAVDVKAENDDYVITALLPGIKAEDLNIQVVNDTVSISGEYKVERDEKDEYLLAERPSGHFSRELTFPVALDAARTEAQIDNGVLTLRAPKAESARPKSIKVIAK